MTTADHVTVTCDRCGTAYVDTWAGVTFVLTSNGNRLADLCGPCIHGTRIGQQPINFPAAMLTALEAVVGTV